MVGGTPGRIRTCGLWVRNPTLYPLSYRRVSLILHQKSATRRRGPSGAGREGFEPSERIFCPQPLSRRPHSTTLAPPQVALFTAGQWRRVHRIRADKFTTRPSLSRDPAARQAGARPHHAVDPAPPLTLR